MNDSENTDDAAQIAELREELDAWRNTDPTSPPPQRVQMLELARDNKLLRAAVDASWEFLRWAEHAEQCGSVDDGGACSCGLDDATAALAKVGRGRPTPGRIADAVVAEVDALEEERARRARRANAATAAKAGPEDQEASPSDSRPQDYQRFSRRYRADRRRSGLGNRAGG